MGDVGKCRPACYLDKANQGYTMRTIEITHIKENRSGNTAVNVPGEKNDTCA